MYVGSVGGVLRNAMLVGCGAFAGLWGPTEVRLVAWLGSPPASSAMDDDVRLSMVNHWCGCCEDKRKNFSQANYSSYGLFLHLMLTATVSRPGPGVGGF